MKKIGIFAVGTFFGIALSITTGVFADSTNLVTGVFSDFKIMINGKDASLENRIVNVEGSTFLPVREISNKLGYEVQFNEGVISLSNDGKKYLKADDSNVRPAPKTEENKQVSNSNIVKDLKTKYSKEGKLDAELVKKAIDSQEISPNAIDEKSGDTLLITVIKENNFPVYQVLKDNKVDPEIPNYLDGKRPIHTAVILKNDFYLSELTTAFKVKTQVKDNDGHLPIDYAEKGSSEFSTLRFIKE
ncbi:hypothetical protein P4H70_15015 [Paenibacillus ehimensis]|uniref:stalk domain-containing protein n=1 Tax=Paenibacillus ehimensis TaxID=79264 RepID=UPI002DBD5092|nr:hypothetical protein [Paenibacillus ehimensis]MEC0210247.1 hypothetical protein [Paenibacillus ehimensis]